MPRVGHVAAFGHRRSTAMQKDAGGIANYRASEGKTVEVGGTQPTLS